VEETGVPGETYILISNTQQTDVGFYVRGTAHVGDDECEVPSGPE